jgi:hypothetical protein
MPVERRIFGGECVPSKRGSNPRPPEPWHAFNNVSRIIVPRYLTNSTPDDGPLESEAEHAASKLPERVSKAHSRAGASAIKYTFGSGKRNFVKSKQASSETECFTNGTRTQLQWLVGWRNPSALNPYLDLDVNLVQPVNTILVDQGDAKTVALYLISS